MKNNFFKKIKIKLKKNHEKYPDDFKYTVEELVGMWDTSKSAVQEWHGEILDNEILKYKTSDTIFVLGSGPSVNEISLKEWDHIRQHNSIGFNWWFAHNFIPDFYMFQAAHDNMLELMKDKYSEYQKVPFLIRGSRFSRGEFNFSDKRLNLLKGNPVYFVNEYPISSKCAIDIPLLFKYMEALGFMTYGHISKFIPKWRGTLGLLIMLCYQMGYKKIVLCGMDMNDSDHFWDYHPYLEVKEKYFLRDKGEANIKTFTDETRSPNTVPRYVYHMRDWMYQKSGVQIFVMKKKTVLYPEINVYRR